eukprot:COSAG05_NODE_1320_length_5193_cov_4.563997_3_plen_221_part_00
MADAVAKELADAAEELKRRGSIEFKRGDFRHAVELFSRASQLEPANSVHLSNRCLALMKLERFDEALRDADAILVLRPDWAKAHYRRAAALHSLERFADAVANYETAASLDADNAQVTKGLAKAKKQLQEAEAAAAAKELAAQRREERRRKEEARRAATGDGAVGVVIDDAPLLTGPEARPYVGWPVGLNANEDRGRGLVARRASCTSRVTPSLPLICCR